MPIESKAQERLMQGVKNNPAFAKKVGIPQKVGAEFVKAGKSKVNLPAKKSSGRGR